MNVTGTNQSSTFPGGNSDRAVDKDDSTVACTGHVSSSEPWWSADLGEPMDVCRVSVTNDNNAHYG